MIGKTLAHYEVLSKIGAGGMGEVYLARDTSLDRQVALKFLTPAMIQDVDHLSRFEREAKLLASLNHPGIAVVYGLHEEEGQRFLAMELVPGTDLHAALAAGPMPVNEAVATAVQIAHALAAAHDQGVVHRDLKPSNIMITPEGKAKVLDFGLAKSVEATGDSALLSNSPTMTSPATMAGVILGTAAYMSPEQARGKPVDRRADLWAFGCVLYEMLTGRTAFQGETVTDIIASVIHKDPDWDALPADLPSNIRRVLERCLRKDPELRLRDAGDAALLLQEPQDNDTATAAATKPASGRRTFITAATIAFLAAVIGTFLADRLSSDQSPPPPAPVQFTIAAPARSLAASRRPQLSPDGTTLLWSGRDEYGQPRVWTRALNALETSIVPMDRSAIAVAWSPDSRNLALFSGGKLRKVPVEGGDLQPLCDMPDNRGVSWGKDYLVFAEAKGPIFRVPVTGGDPEPVTTVRESEGEIAHRHPHFLPDGETFLYVSLPGKRRLLTVYAGHVDGREPVAVTTALNSSVYVNPGYLLFQRGRSLVAQSFDLKTLTVSGEPFVVAPANDLHENVGLPIVSASRNGYLSYPSLQDPNTRLTWVDASTGKELGDLDLPPGTYDAPAVSPDGRHVALMVSESPEESDIWVLELERMLLTRFTQGPGPHQDPIWSPDGKYLAYCTNTDGPWDIYRKPFPAGGPAEPIVVGPEAFKNPLDWSPDGKYLLYDRLGVGTEMDVWVAPADGSGEPRLYQGGETNQREARFSPDGRWVAYTSFETGSPEIYVSSFPDPTQKHRISVEGGNSPYWNPDGSGIWFADIGTGDAMTVTFRADPDVKTGLPRRLFASIPNIRGDNRAPDGRFLIVRPATETIQTSSTVMLHWTPEN